MDEVEELKKVVIKAVDDKIAMVQRYLKHDRNDPELKAKRIAFEEEELKKLQDIKFRAENIDGGFRNHKAETDTLKRYLTDISDVTLTYKK